MFLRKILSTKFSKEGFVVMTAASGEQALDIINEDQPHIMLLDLILPQMSGYEVLNEIKRNSKTKDLKFIVLSNLSQDEDVKRVMELGALSFLIKAEHSINQIVSRVKEEFAKLAK